MSRQLKPFHTKTGENNSGRSLKKGLNKNCSFLRISNGNYFAFAVVVE